MNPDFVLLISGMSDNFAGELPERNGFFNKGPLAQNRLKMSALELALYLIFNVLIDVTNPNMLAPITTLGSRTAVLFTSFLAVAIRFQFRFIRIFSLPSSAM